MRKFKRMIVCVMTAVMTISCMPGVSALAGESETTMAEELAVGNNSVARAVASYYYDYDCTSYTKVGHVTTAGTTMTLIYNASTKGKVKITVKDSSGNIAKIIYPPAEGSTGTSLSTTFGVSKGKTYYFYTEPTGANNRTAGSFRVRC